MKIAVPVKMNRENPPLAPLFGKAKWFAMIEDGETPKIEIVENPVHGGKAVVEWLSGKGIDTIIFQEMGESPYHMIKEIGGIKLFHAGNSRILLSEVLEKMHHNCFIAVDDSNISEIIAHHEAKPTHRHRNNESEG